MKYAIYINAHLTKETMLKADTLNIGMIEEVLPSLISWHELESYEVPVAIDFIRKNFGNIKIEVAETYWYSPAYSYDLIIMGVQLFSDGTEDIHFTTSKKQAENILADLKGMYKADALYMDTIIKAVTADGFWKLIRYGLIESCGEFNGRKLYAI